ncbi:twin-arginine translocase TatA/TatE family subunit [Crocinitomicaceae bacterium]|nr:twin-arginine translocase TatA/TatE family subunit [Crocinitomicaceae bacterium]
MQLIFNDIGGGEIVLILIFILIFFGAKSIPGLARTFGRTIRQVREASSDIQNEIRKSGDEMKKDLNLEGTIRETAEDIRRPLDQYAADLEDSMKYQPPKRTSHVKPMGHDLKQVDPPKAIEEEVKNPIIEEKETKVDQSKAEDKPS